MLRPCVLCAALIPVLFILPAAGQKKRDVVTVRPVAFQTEADRAPSIVLNGGFEDVEVTGMPTDWFSAFLPETAEFVQFEADTDVRHSGRQSVSLAIDANHPDTPVAYNWLQLLQGWEVGGTYRATVWVRTRDVVETPFVVVQFFRANETLIGIASSVSEPRNVIVGTRKWKKLRFDFTVPVGTATVFVRAGMATPANAGAKIWFDDVKIKLL